jgi:hypothetical protein
MPPKLQRSYSNISDLSDDLSDDYDSRVDDNDSSLSSLLSELSNNSLQSFARSLSSLESNALSINPSVLNRLNMHSLASIAQTISRPGVSNGLTNYNVANLIVLQSAISAQRANTKKNAPPVSTVGMPNILPPQLLRRSKGEVKITNTNLQDPKNNPVEVLLSTITPTYGNQSEIFPELLTVIDKIYDKIASCPDLKTQNDEILKLIKKVKQETAGLNQHIPFDFDD